MRTRNLLLVLVCWLAPVAAWAAFSPVQPPSLATCLSNAGAGTPNPLAQSQCVSYENAAATAAADPQPGGTITYFCDCQTGADANCVAGNDANPGTKASPKQTYSAALTVARAMTAGSAVEWCRGGSVATNGIGSTVLNSNCTVGSPCILRDYVPTTFTPAVDHRPILLSGGVASNILQLNGSISTEQKGWKIENIDFEGDSTTSGIVAINLSNWVHDVLIQGCTFNGFINDAVLFNNWNSSAGFPGCYTPSPHSNTCHVISNVNILGNDFSNNKAGALSIYGDNVHANSNYGFKSGADVSADHFLYWFAAEDGTGGFPQNQYCTVGEQANNNVIIDPGLSGTCDGAILIAHACHDGLQVNGNFIGVPSNTRTGNCQGLGLGTGTNIYPDDFINLQVLGNIIYKPSNAGIVVNGAYAPTIANNLIVTDDPSGAFSGVVLGQISGDQYDLGTSNGILSNNGVYATTSSNTNMGFSIKGEGVGYTYTNNWAMFDNTTSGRTFYCYEYLLGGGAVQGTALTPSSVVSSLQSISNGGFDITLANTLLHVTGANFSTDTPAVTAGTDGVVSGTGVFTVTNETFTGMSPPPRLVVSGAANSGNNGTFYCSSIGAHTCTASSTSGLVTETFGAGVTFQVKRINDIYDAAAITRTRMQAALSTAQFQLIQPTESPTSVYPIINVNAGWSATNGTAQTSLASAPTTGATAIQTIWHLDSGSSATVVPAFSTANNNACNAPAGPTLTYERQTGNSVTSFASNTGSNGASFVGSLGFVTMTLVPSTGVLGYFAPQVTSKLTAGGNATNAQSTDLNGAAWGGQVSIGPLKPYTFAGWLQ